MELFITYFVFGSLGAIIGVPLGMAGYKVIRNQQNPHKARK